MGGTAVSDQDRPPVADKKQKPRKSLFQELLETLLLTLVLFGVARFSLQNFKVDSIARGGPGPLTPPLQWLWKQPLLKIFCNYSRPSRFVVRFCPPGWS